MNTFSRRQFLKSLGAVSTFFLTNQTSFSFAKNSESFEMLVVGDSLIWGQGLEEKDKIYTLTKNWLEVAIGKNINLKVKAHSGATIFLPDHEAKLLQKRGMAETNTFYPEINLSFPTLKAQIENAKNEYQNSANVNLVLLTGGIGGITGAGVLNPFGNNKTLQNDIKKYCNEEMFCFLEYSANVFPNALFAVIGYFPILSQKSDTSKLFNSFLRAYAIPSPIKPLANNILIRQLFKLIKNKALRRSRLWFEDSNRELNKAVNRLNEKFGKQRAVFIKSPLTEANAFETEETQLFKLEKKGQVNDEFYDERLIECRKTLSELKKIIGLKQSVRQCEIAAIGHITSAGSKAYAEAVKTTLTKILQTEFKSKIGA